MAHPVFSEVFETFIVDQNEWLSSDLGRAITRQFGGEKAFMDVYIDVITSSPSSALTFWIKEEDITDFFLANKSNILLFINKECHLYKMDTAEYFDEIAGGTQVIGGQYDAESLDLAVHNPESPLYNRVIKSMVMVVGWEFAHGWQHNIEQIGGMTS